MKILIAADMEGITGVTHWNHVTPDHPEYQRYRRLMTQDVNAAVRGAFEGGAQEVVVTDGHNLGDNLLIEEIDSRVRLNSGQNSPLSMLQGIQDGADGVLFIGYHARNGTQNAILDHTWSSVRVQDVWLNDRPVGEIGLNASLCGHFGAPVLLLSGDQSAAQEARAWIPGIDTVVVKQASGRSAAELLPPAVTQTRIAQAASQALQRLNRGQAPQPVLVDAPVKIAIAFKSSDMADRAACLPTSRRIDGRTIEFTAPDMHAAYVAFKAAVMLG